MSLEKYLAEVKERWTYDGANMMDSLAIHADIEKLLRIVEVYRAATILGMNMHIDGYNYCLFCGATPRNHVEMCAGELALSKAEQIVGEK